MTEHVGYIVDTDKKLQTSNGVNVSIADLLYEPHEEALSKWAQHIRGHYCTIESLDEDRTPTGKTRREYLRDIKIPDDPSIISGDFAEILIADYLEYRLNYLVPRTRYDYKINKNDSPKGTDIIGFKVIDKESISPNDELITCEVKAALSSKSKTTLERALNDSMKDFHFRKGESLNAMRQRLKISNLLELMVVVERFQNKTDRPYKEVTSAVAVHSNHTWDELAITQVSTVEHPNNELLLFVVRGEKLMDLAYELYRRVCDEA